MGGATDTSLGNLLETSRPSRSFFALATGRFPSRPFAPSAFASCIDKSLHIIFDAERAQKKLVPGVRNTAR